MEFTVPFGYILMIFGLSHALKLTLEFSKIRFCKRLIQSLVADWVTVLVVHLAVRMGIVIRILALMVLRWVDEMDSRLVSLTAAG